MKNNNNYTSPFLSSRKTFYITVALGLVAVIVAAVAVKMTSGRVKRELSSIADENNSALTSDVGTPIDDEPDTRDFSDDNDEPEDSTSVEAKTTPERTTQGKKKTEPKEPSTGAVAKISNSSYLAPLKGNVTKAYSPQVPIENKTMGDYRTHSGADFEGSEGEDVLSVGNGVVTRVLVDSMWGYVIEIDHGDFTARYIGLSQEDAVSINDEVKPGEKIGVLTSIPAEREDGIHLHFEVLKDGKAINPLAALGIAG